MKQRRVVPEILDSLPHDDPEALRSRRDIRRINSAMGSYRWIVRQMRKLQIPDANWVELGAGSGTLADHFDGGEQNEIRVSGLDLAPRPENWPEHWNWEQGDLFDSLERNENSWNAATGNLILHHFDDDGLRKLGRHLSRFRALVFSEPARYRLHHFEIFAIAPFINRVSRNDGHLSINAGFRGNELPELLGLDHENWVAEVSRTWLGGYRLVAFRREGNSPPTKP